MRVALGTCQNLIVPSLLRRGRDRKKNNGKNMFHSWGEEYLKTEDCQAPTLGRPSRRHVVIMIIRILLALFLAAATLFCVFGFVATFEPLPVHTQWVFRGIYGLIFVGNVAGLVHLIRGIFNR